MMLAAGGVAMLYRQCMQCMFKHPYPIGYKASKAHFNAVYTMEILEGPPNEGPVFTVRHRRGPRAASPKHNV